MRGQTFDITYNCYITYFWRLLDVLKCITDVLCQLPQILKPKGEHTQASYQDQKLSLIMHSYMNYQRTPFCIMLCYY